MPSALDMSVIAHDSIDAMAEALAREIAARLTAAIDERGRASIAVSGGSTPKPLYQRLSKMDLDWSKVTAVLVDERWVEPGQPGSNEDFVRDSLLQNEAAGATFIGLKTPGLKPADGLQTAEGRLADLPLPLDVCILGMGNDGHTASWFPHATGLDTCLGTDRALLAAVRAEPSEVTGDHLDRITLTRRPVAQSGVIYLMISGEAKHETLKQAVAGRDVSAMPVRTLLQDDALPLSIHWAS